MKIAVIGAGWAGLAAAVTLQEAKHQVTVFEATHHLGGRARALKTSAPLQMPNGQVAQLDNGQHILIGAYTETLRLMRQVGVVPEQVLLNLPLSLQFPDGQGLQFSKLPTPLDALTGILSAKGWRMADKFSLLRAALGWQLNKFQCAEFLTVAQLCQGLTPRVQQELIDPLCVSALNTPSQQASAQVFLRVLQDALFAVSGGSRLLLPRADLSQLFPQAAAQWLSQRGARLALGQRILKLQPVAEQWQVGTELFDRVLLAVAPRDALQILGDGGHAAATSQSTRDWITRCKALQFESITTVYAWAPQAKLHQPMLALRSTPDFPAQFVFDRGQLGGAQGLLAFVVSAGRSERQVLEAQVLAQAQAQLGLNLQALKTVCEKHATFACTAGMQRPGAQISQGLIACGDYVAGPYPATLEGAVRSGIQAAQMISLSN
jgi:squalene-associated FAD-dependent desaturase